MIEITLGNEVPLNPRMKVFANEYHTKKDYIAFYNKLLEPSFNADVNTKNGKLKALMLTLFLDKLNRTPDREYLALGELTSLIIETKHCSKTKCSLFLSEFINHGIFIEQTVLASDLNRTFPLISFPKTIENLDQNIDAYINFLSGPESERTHIPYRSKAQLINEQIDDDNIPSSHKLTNNKNVIVIKNNKTSSILKILSAVCPFEQKLIQDGTLEINTNDSAKSVMLKYRTTSWTDSDSVMMFQDLKYYYALITLTYHAHVSRFSEYHRKQITPSNICYIHLDDILALTAGGNRKSFGGTQRSECRESLQRIRKTNIEIQTNSLIDLSSIASNSAEHKILQSKSEIVLNPLKSLSRVELINTKGEWGESTMDYLVQLPDDIFKSMFTSDFHWIFPPSFLTIDEILFALYIYLRNNWVETDKKNKKFEISDFYLNHEGSSRNALEFQAKFKTLLTKLDKYGIPLKIKKSLLSVTKVKFKNEFKLKLFGYNCLVDFSSKTISVELNQETFFEALEMPPGKRNTPTWSNKLSTLSFSDLLRKKNLTQEDKKLISEIENNSANMLARTRQSLLKKLPRLIQCVYKRFGYIECRVGDKDEHNFHITLLTSQEDLDKIAIKLSNTIAINIDEISYYLQTLTDTIPNKFVNQRFTAVDFKSVYSRFLATKNEDGSSTKDTIEQQINFFNLASDSPESFKFMMSFAV